MYVVRCTYHHGIDVLILFRQHFAEIMVSLCIWILSESAPCLVLINIAQRHNVFTADCIDITAAATAYTDTGNIELLISRTATWSTQHMPGNDCKCRHRR